MFIISKRQGTKPPCGTLQVQELLPVTGGPNTTLLSFLRTTTTDDMQNVPIVRDLILEADMLGTLAE